MLYRLFSNGFLGNLFTDLPSCYLRHTTVLIDCDAKVTGQALVLHVDPRRF